LSARFAACGHACLTGRIFGSEPLRIGPGEGGLFRSHTFVRAKRSAPMIVIRPQTIQDHHAWSFALAVSGLWQAKDKA